MPLDEQAALGALKTVYDPDLRQDLVSLGMIRDLAIDGDAVSLRVVLTTPACPLKEQIRGEVEAALTKAGAKKIAVTMDAEMRRAAAPAAGGRTAGPGQVTQSDRMPGVKAIVAVAAGKGGVGKSTVAVNLAITLSRLGAKVGLLDADIYGPSIPIMLGLKGARPSLTAAERIAPMQRYGLQVMSMGFMLQEDQAVVWRGPMLGKALQQFIEDVDWGDLDYVIVDMPPGTGDVQLSLAQLLPVAGCVVVTTPQDVAFADVRRAIKQLELTKTEVLGIVENMTNFICGNCGAEHAIFGESRIGAHAEAMKLDVLGRIPLDAVTAIAADQGEPICLAAPDSAAARVYTSIAQTVARRIAVITHQRNQVTPKFQAFFGQRPS